MGGSDRNFPNNPDKPNKKTAIWTSVKLLFLAFIETSFD